MARYINSSSGLLTIYPLAHASTWGISSMLTCIRFLDQSSGERPGLCPAFPVSALLCFYKQCSNQQPCPCVVSAHSLPPPSAPQFPGALTLVMCHPSPACWQCCRLGCGLCILRESPPHRSGIVLRKKTAALILCANQTDKQPGASLI